MLKCLPPETVAKVRVQLPTSADNVTLLAFAAERRAGRRYQSTVAAAGCTAPVSQTRRSGVWRTNDGTDRRTAGSFMAPAPHTMRAVSIMSLYSEDGWMAQ